MIDSECERVILLLLLIVLSCLLWTTDATAQSSCAAVPAGILINPPALVGTSGIINTGSRSIAWDPVEEAVVVNVDIDASGGLEDNVIEVGSLSDHWFFNLESEYYTAFVQTQIVTSSPGLQVHPNSTVMDVLNGAAVLANGVTSATIHGDTATYPFYLYLTQPASSLSTATNLRLVAQWKIAVRSYGCPNPFSTSTSFEPVPVPTTSNADIYNLDGDYGEVGRLFDFRAIFGVLQGLVDIIGVANLRDYIALGAAGSILAAALLSSRPNTNNPSQ